jgi:hypothetical protein
MDENTNIIDQSQLAEDVASKIKYSFFDHFLIKPLDPVKVKKEFSKPVTNGVPTKDADGIEAQDFDKVETEVKEVNSDYLKGVVIKLPMYYESSNAQEGPYKDVRVGDIVVFRATAGLPFDLVRDSRLIRLYDILGVEK